MNQLWVRISLTYVAIMIFLIIIPAMVYITIQADVINQNNFQGEGIIGEIVQEEKPPLFMVNLLGLQRASIAIRLVRVFLFISFIGILVGVISSRGLTAPLNNLAKAARAVGSQDLSQRIDEKGSSEVREVARAFNSMTAALEKADQIRSSMLADIAHELRTPLTVIQGNLRAILDDVYDLDKTEVARLYDQTRQLSRLVDDLHDLTLLESQQFSLNLEELNLIAVIQDIAGIYQPIFDDQGVELKLDLPDQISPVRADCSRITQCLNNLINNALRYTESGGKITLALSEQDDQIQLIVRDNGTGIDPEHLPYIFDRFYRVDPDRNRLTGGSGLGLAITQALVQAHQGQITAHSPGLGQGSEFSFSIPIKA